MLSDEECKKAIENDVPYVPCIANYKKKNEATLGRKSGKKLLNKKHKQNNANK